LFFVFDGSICGVVFEVAAAVNDVTKGWGEKKIYHPFGRRRRRLHPSVSDPVREHSELLTNKTEVGQLLMYYTLLVHK
jgi:hypothetical protein